MPIKRLDAREELLVVAAVDQDRGVVLDALGQHRKGARRELLLLLLAVGRLLVPGTGNEVKGRKKKDEYGGAEKGNKEKGGTVDDVP